MRSQFITPTVSVFDHKGRPDPEQNHRLYDHLVKGGVSGMVILGSTGEFFSMDMETSKKFIDIAASYKRSNFRFFVGTSRMDPEESVVLANHAADKGADGVMIISPYYFPLKDDSVYDYYSTIAPRVSCPIFIYNFPDRTGYSVSPEVTLKLASKFKNITGFKDTIPGINHTCDLIRTVRSELPYFEIFSGFDNNFAHNVLSGGSGCIGGLSNLIPEVFAKWIAAFEHEDVRKIAEMQRYIDKMMAVYGIGDPFIPIIKKGTRYSRGHRFRRVHEAVPSCRRSADGKNPGTPRHHGNPEGPVTATRHRPTAARQRRYRRDPARRGNATNAPGETL